ncbi:Rieske 2Fe-2S domain-containing protein [Xanthobacter sp. KR7-65]|uniref:Rieske (2Fe-2S) protein n=1 Tax=Xanthobacter sp. KR7-65 TaxID=3156612 RepID=UPI0032B42AC1
MAGDEIEIYAICETREIDPGRAKAFDLSRITPEGEARPFRIVVVRTGARDFVGYVNVCPHKGAWLNIGGGEFFNKEGTRLRCGRHGALFDIESGACMEGPCEGEHLEPIALAVVGADVCLCGVTLVEEEARPFPYDDFDDTMEIMISPD